MDKIDGLGAYLFRPDAPKNQAGAGRKKGKAEGSRSFSSLFTRNDATSAAETIEHEALIENPEELRKVLEGYVDDVHRLGDALAKRPNQDNLVVYRQAVGRFLRLVVRSAFGTEEHLSKRDILNQKKYVLVTTLDQKLERLALGILQSQESSLQILARLEEINGLIVDLLQ